MRRPRSKPPRSRWRSRARADVLLQARQGQVSPCAAARARRRARLGRAQEARSFADGPWGDELRRAACLTPSGRSSTMLLYQPDKNTIEWKTLAAACDTARVRSPCSPRAAPFPRRTTTTTTRSWRRRSRGIRLRPTARRRQCPSSASRRPRVLDRRRDDDGVDDAFSVRELPNGHYEIGVHIAAPALGIRGSRGRLARARLSTVYMPGRKITMFLTTSWTHSRWRKVAVPPACRCTRKSRGSGHCQAGARVNRVPIAANRLEAIGDAFAADLPWPSDPPWTDGVRVSGSSRNACRMRAGRRTSRASTTAFTSIGTRRRKARAGRVTDRPAAARQPARQAHRRAHDLRQQPVGQAPRQRAGRGPLPNAVERQGEDEHRPGEHQGLGVAHYLWSSSPLRRYSDLVNQRQPLATLDGRKPPYAENDAELFPALNGFQATYSELRRVPGPDGALPAPALACAGGCRRNHGDGHSRHTGSLDQLPLVVRLADLPALLQKRCPDRDRSHRPLRGHARVPIRGVRRARLLTRRRCARLCISMPSPL